MFVILSKILPSFVYPLGLALLLVGLALFLLRRPRLQQAMLLLAFLILWMGSNRWVAFSLVRSLEWHYLPYTNVPPSDVIVILGGGTESQQYPRPTVEINGGGDRVIYGASLYHAGKAPAILVSGGVIDFLGARMHTPAEDMVSLLSMLGVPEQVVWIQPESRNTYEDALYSRQLLEEKGIQRIILVTSASHMPRSVALFERQGFEVIPAPTDFLVTQAGWDSLWKPTPASFLVNLLPDASNLAYTTTALKEYLGILTYRLRGWL